MLESLKVRNYVLIDNLDLDFTEGFSVLTGETGSGKTIIMGALSLLLGQKADKEAVRKGAESAEVSALFFTEDKDIISYLDSIDIECDGGEILIRRVIKVNGRSSYTINGTPVTRIQGETLGKMLVDVSSQHAHQSLMDDSVLLRLLDEYSSSEEYLEAYKKSYSELKDSEKKLSELEDMINKSVEEADYIQFCLGELDNADLKIGEEESLKEEIQIMSSSEYLRESLTSVQDDLRSAESMLSSALASLRKAEKKDPRLGEYAERLDSQTIEADDIFSSIRDYLSSISYSEYELEAKNSRLSQIQRIKRRFGGTVEEAIRRREEYREKLQASEDGESMLQALSKRVDALKHETEKLSDKLTDVRKKGAKKLSKRIEDNLHNLGMQSALFRIDIDDCGFTPTGSDKVSFMIAANKGEKIADIKSSSSGGELSRIMLAIKVSLNSTSGVNTLIFDEIDTGLGGVVANAVSEELKELSSTHQVLAITHLSQIAAKADSHYLVYKEEVKDRTISHIRKIEGEDRVKEIARLLSGETSDISLEHARSLLEVKC